MMVLFMTIAGGIDWKDIYAHWSKLDPLYGCVFVIYVSIMIFGVLNVVVATFIKATMENVARNRTQLIFQEMEKLEDYAQKVGQFFMEADANDSGTLSWEEFQAHMAEPRVKAFFQALELDTSQAHKLFELLDVDGDNQVSIEEFQAGCMRLRGTARNVDLNVVLLNTQRLSSQITSLVKKNG